LFCANINRIVQERKLKFYSSRIPIFSHNELFELYVGISDGISLSFYGLAAGVHFAI
jgi:spore cortex formation protein SpoVR/YcgB (stage V sporulation)